MSDYKDFYEQHVNECDFCNTIMERQDLSKDQINELVDAHVTKAMDDGQAQAEYAYEAWKERQT